jgi:hypothetical protein
MGPYNVCYQWLLRVLVCTSIIGTLLLVKITDQDAKAWLKAVNIETIVL